MSQSQDIDPSKLTPQELKLYKLYGKLPKRSDLLQSKLKDRKYFDSGDYAMSKAGVIDNPSSLPVEKLEHPDLEKIQRINRNSISGGQSGQIFNNGSIVGGSSGSPTGSGSGASLVNTNPRMGSVAGVIGAQNGGNVMLSGRSSLENEVKDE